MNGDHEYVIFDPQGEETHELNVIPQKNHAELEETSKLFLQIRSVRLHIMHRSIFTVLVCFKRKL